MHPLDARTPALLQLHLYLCKPDFARPRVLERHATGLKIEVITVQELQIGRDLFQAHGEAIVQTKNQRAALVAAVRAALLLQFHFQWCRRLLIQYFPRVATSLTRSHGTRQPLPAALAQAPAIITIVTCIIFTTTSRTVIIFITITSIR